MALARSRPRASDRGREARDCQAGVDQPLKRRNADRREGRKGGAHYHLLVVPINRLGHTPRLRFPLHLERHADGCLSARTISDVFEVDEARLQAYPLADAYRARIAQLVQAVIDPHADPLHGHDLFHQMGGERERVVSVRDRPTEGRFLFRPLRIDMDPLVVVRRVRELVDLFLSDRVPVRNTDLLTLHRLELFEAQRSSGHALTTSSIIWKVDNEASTTRVSVLVLDLLPVAHFTFVDA